MATDGDCLFKPLSAAEIAKRQRMFDEAHEHAKRTTAELTQRLAAPEQESGTASD